MTDEQRIIELGLKPEQIDAVLHLLEERARDLATPRAAEFLRRVFLRADRDSVAGRALARALGFTDDISCERAAKAFCVSKQYLNLMENELRQRLAGIEHDEPAAIPSDAAGPSRESASHRIQATRDFWRARRPAKTVDATGRLLTSDPTEKPISGPSGRPKWPRGGGARRGRDL